MYVLRLCNRKACTVQVVDNFNLPPVLSLAFGFHLHHFAKWIDSTLARTKLHQMNVCVSLNLVYGYFRWKIIAAFVSCSVRSFVCVCGEVWAFRVIEIEIRDTTRNSIPKITSSTWKVPNGSGNTENRYKHTYNDRRLFSLQNTFWCGNHFHVSHLPEFLSSTKAAEQRPK